ncbi:L-lactate dehydrogenase, putative [Theileria annulata]|uniref:L-lactate dehydrogenase n=1 Tax=Theileria annulata TaxID=5874 RepID=Q4UJ29_THEAN|nr:L-lactate dehydrogenase, putative [Theileria annulata]CAI72910.1 L-lactate dehydrogenase, putative [Theileria annulata]|eukprot:XP_953588.1 L-lactate dehydrogenase, putative [Theileria annulata]
MARNNKRKLISLIGSGNIGGIMGYLTQLTELADVNFFDIVPNIGAGKSLDIMHANSIQGKAYKCKGTNNYEDISGSDVCIVTAGNSYEENNSTKIAAPGKGANFTAMKCTMGKGANFTAMECTMGKGARLAKAPTKSNEEWNRDDLVGYNSKIIRDVGENIKKYAPEAFVIVITNPMDVMVHLMLKVTGFPKNMVVGMGGLLDSSRMNCYIAEKLGVNPKYVHGSVIGAHGDSMIPLVSRSTVYGIPILQFVEQGYITMEDIKEIEERTVTSAFEILKLYGSGSSYFAPATAAIEMASSYLNDKKCVFPCSCYLEGQYGHRDIYCGTPAVIGANGVEKVFELKLTPEEQDKYDASIKEIKRLEALIK